MRPLWYCDLLPLVVGGDTGMSGPVVRGRMLALLHGLFAQSPATYAIALPPARVIASRAVFGGALRVFASSRSELDELASATSAMPWFRDYARLAYPCEVPATFAGTWTCFCRYRVPTLKQDRHGGEQHGQLRARRLGEAHRLGLEYFILDSASNRQRFTLYVQTQEGQAQNGECTPNSYGLCVPSRKFGLPELPWQ